MSATPPAAPPTAPAAPSGAGTVARHSAAIAVAGLLGKAVGLVREAVIGRAFGAGAGTDLLFLALSVPNTLAAVVSGGGMRVVFQPELARRLVRGEDEARRYATLVLAGVGGLALATMTGIALAAGPLSVLLAGDAPGLPPLLRLVSPMVPLLALLDLYTGLLHARLRFTWPSLDAVIRNGAVVAVVLALASLGVASVALGHLAGTALLVLACALAARGAGFRLARWGAGERGALRALARAAPVAVLGSVFHPACVLVDRAMAARLGPGAASALAYADPLWQAGLVVAGPVSTVALPVLAGLAARGDDEHFSETVRSTVRGTVFLTAPLAALLVALAEPAVQVLYLRGRFDAHAATMTAQAAMFLALCLPSTAAQGVLLRALQARGRYAATGWISAAAIGLHALLNWPLMHLLGHRGIALSLALSYAALFWLLDRELALRPPGRAAFAARTAACAGAAGLAAWAAAAALPASGPSALGALARLALGGAAGLAAWLGTALLVRAPELRDLARFARRR